MLFKLKQNGVSGNLFHLITSFLSGIFQRVLLNGQTSDWETAVPQSSILEPLFFPVSGNFLKNNLKNSAKLFGEDTSFLSEICDPLQTADLLNND